MRRSLFAFIVLFCATVSEAVGATEPVPAQPRLILTPTRIADLKATATSTRRELWGLARASADEFARREAPKMTDASNKFREIGDTLPALGLAFLITGERRYVEAADRWLNALLAVADYKGSQNLGRSAFVTGMALTDDWIGRELPEATRSRLRARLAAESEILMGEGAAHRQLSNHNLIETTALGLAGLVLQGQHPRAAAFVARARERTELIIKYAPRDGSWGEGTQYWAYGLGYFVRLLEALKTAGVADYFPRYDWLKQTGYFAIHLSLPGRPDETVPFSDSGDQHAPAFLFYMAGALERNGYFQDYANKIRARAPYKFSWLDCLAFDPSIAPKDFTALPRFHHFDDNGFVIMRSGWSGSDTLVGFRCGPAPGHRNQADPDRVKLRGFGPGHGHPDVNSFCIFANGQWLALDPGYVHEKWAREHNTIVVNGRGQAGEGSGEWLDYMAFESREPAPKILRAESSAVADYVIGDAGNIYVDEASVAHFRRHLLFLKPGVVVILDDIATKKPSQVEWLLQASERTTESAPHQFEIARGGVRLSVQSLLPARVEAKITAKDIHASMVEGKTTTLDLAAESANRLTFLVVLGVLPNAGTRAPEATLSGGHLRINFSGRSWDVAVLEPSPATPDAPLLRLNTP